MPKVYDTTIKDGDTCSFCGAPAKKRSRHTGNYSCEDNTNNCPAVRQKNANGLKVAYTEGRKTNQHFFDPTFDEKRAWSRGKTVVTDPRVSKRSLAEYFCANSTVARSAIRNLILKNNLLEYKCAECGIDSWNNKILSLQLDHINGENNDHRIDNLRFLCPNCHSQTPTFCGKNKNTGKHKVSDKVLLETLNQSDTIHQALRKLGLSIGKEHYRRATKLLEQNLNARVS